MAAWIAPAVMGVAYIAQSIWGSSIQEQNAEVAAEWAAYNAAQAQQTAEFNATAIEELAAVNSNLIYTSAENSAVITESLAKFNAALRVQVAEYNAQLLEKEAALVWEAQELDQIIYAREAERTIKDIRAGFASRGVEIAVGSPVDYVVDQATQAKLESFVIRHNADIQMTKLLDAAALSRWEGQAAAAAIVYESQLTALSTRTQGKLDATMVDIQGAYDAAMTRFNGTTESYQILQEGLWQSSQYSQAATQTLITGLFQGTASLIQAYESATASKSLLDEDYIDIMNSDLYSYSTGISIDTTLGES